MRTNLMKIVVGTFGAVCSSLGMASAQDALPNQVVVHYVDVDQGAAALVEFPCGAVMIDAGGRAARAHLLSYIDAFFARRTDLNHRFKAVFITHTHLDHNAYLLNVLDRYYVDALVETGRVNGVISKDVPARLSAKGIKREIVTEARVARAGTAGVSNTSIDPFTAENCQGVDPTIRVLSGAQNTSSGAFKNENNHSLVIRIDYGDASFLWTGDMEEPALKRLVPRYAGTPMLDTDVYEAGHHGSHNATTSDLLAAVSPQLSIISMGHQQSRSSKTAWDYGHPNTDIVEMLHDGITATRPPVDGFVGDGAHALKPYRETQAIYATGWDGDVLVTGDAQGQLLVKIASAPAQPVQ